MRIWQAQVIIKDSSPKIVQCIISHSQHIALLQQFTIALSIVVPPECSLRLDPKVWFSSLMTQGWTFIQWTNMSVRRGTVWGINIHNMNLMAGHHCPVIHQLNPKAHVNVKNGQLKVMKVALWLSQRPIHALLFEVGYLQPQNQSLGRLRFIWDTSVRP